MENNKEVINRLAIGASQGLAGTIVGRILGVLTGVIAARILGPAAYGLYSIGWTLLRFLSLLFPLGMDRALLKFAPPYYGKDAGRLKGLLLQGILLAFFSGSICGLVLFSLSPWLANAVYKKAELISIFRLFSLSFPLISLLIVISAATRITQRVKISILVQDIGQPLLGLILMVILYFLGLKINGVILSEVISFFLATVLMLFMIRKVFPEIIDVRSTFSQPLLRIFRYSVPAALGGAFSVYIFWIDRILVGFFRSSFENGIYMAASQISTFFLVISAGINMIVVPIFSDLFNKKDISALEEIYRISTKWGFYIGAPVLVVIFISPNEALSLVFGNSYSQGGNLLLLLAIGQAVNLITGSGNPLLMMTGNQKFLFRLSTLILVVDLLINLYLIPVYGPMGAAFSTTISLSALNLISLFWIKQKLGLWPYDRRYIKGIIAIFATVLFVLIIRSVFSSGEIFGVILQSTGALLSFVLILHLQKLDQEDFQFLNAIRRKILT